MDSKYRQSLGPSRSVGLWPGPDRPPIRLTRRLTSPVGFVASHPRGEGRGEGRREGP